MLNKFYFDLEMELNQNFIVRADTFTQGEATKIKAC